MPQLPHIVYVAYILSGPFVESAVFSTMIEAEDFIGSHGMRLDCATIRRVKV